MLKIFTLFALLTSTLISINGQHTKVAILSGKITNTEETSIKLSHTELSFEKKINVDPEGNFRDTIKFLENASYYFGLGKTTTQVFIKDGDNLTISADAQDFHKTIKYSGIGSEVNNFNLEYAKLRLKLVGDAKEYFLVPLKDFNEKNIKNKAAYLALLNESQLTEKEKALFTKIIENDYLLIHNNYDKFNHYHLKEHPVLPANYYDPILAMYLDDQELFLYDKNYRILVIEKYRQTLRAAMKADTTLTNIEFVKETTKDMKSIYNRESIISMLFNNVNNKNANYQSDYEKIMVLLQSKELKGRLNARLQTALNTTSGTKSIGFNYERMDGSKVALSDLKGKYVYIDIWATWCGPCIKQMPALKEIIKAYEGDDIAFVVISVDDKKDQAKWKKMVPVYNVGGTHLISDNALNSEFMKAYSVGLIPRSILLDREGKVINNNAPKPSDENLKTVLNQLINSAKTIKGE
jgi:thiol-disulfide isomerase/thioredoxin